jgi:tRNA A-37 threonylcarbamoyl transferase component Bud32/uncharacterized RDD family membrane protein YckC
MNTIRLCPGCGAPLTSDSPGGLCPQCLLRTQVIGDEELAALPTARAVPVPGESFGDYRILKLLGHGGMGEVYEAEHITTARRVALKVMRHTLASEQDRKRFLREGRLAASVNHPNVVYIHGSEEIARAPAIAMELVHGGTLKDRLKREGPLPIPDAVEAALQVIDGLEAAHAAGVLHRDIKPANCFVAADGMVKVGDFGLSVSTLARGESLITASGSVMGTPAYASPEQLRGEELDVTSEIYSVGATLYHLLTGKTPFNATDFVKLITEVLDKQPAAPKTLRTEIPAELSKILLRCLAKDRKARFQSYADLRDALLSFRAVEVTPAKPAMRFLAAWIDELIAYGPSLLFLTYWSLDPLDKFAHERTLHAALVWLPFYVWYLCYYAVSEGLWGAAIGKSICGLRVIGRDAQRPGIASALMRVFVYSLPLTLPAFVLMATVPLNNLSVGSETSEWLTGREGSQFTDWLWIPLTVLLFVTMRSRNGYAALQDLASRTRVIVRPKTQPRPALSQEALPGIVPSPTLLSHFGPFQVNAQLWKNNGEELVLGFDAALQRKVWIHLRPMDAAPVSEARRELSRPSRLRWINHGATETQRWDAYEALDGAAFVSVVQQPQKWSAVRFWLLDLAEGFSAALESTHHPVALAIDRLWITNSGRAVLLDFLAPETSMRAVPPTSLDGLEGMQQFLDSVARLALQGTHGAAEKSPQAAGMVIPLHARNFLASLARGTFDHARFIVGNLQSLIAKPAEITHARRAASLAFVPAVALALSAILVATIMFDQIRWSRAWAGAFGGQPSLRIVAEIYEDEVADLKLGKQNEADVTGTYIAAHFGQFVTNELFWKSPPGRMLSPQMKFQVRQAAEKYSSPEASLVAKAERDTPKRIAKRERRRSLASGSIGAGMLLCVAGLAALTDLIGALGFRTFPLLRLFGFSVVNRRGEPASRARLFTRWLIVWVPACTAMFDRGHRQLLYC